MDDIHTEFHPHARITTCIEAFSDFTRQHHYEPPCPDCQPWLPFRCQLDFEVAELVHETALTHEQTTHLIRLVQRGRTEDFTLKNYADVWNTWEAASHCLTLFEKDTITVPLDGNNMDHTVYFRSLWDWGVDLLRHPDIGPHCIFDAQRLSKFDGDLFIRFIDEPWTADAFWECQSQIPPVAKPLAFILYADKSKLSSFGREKRYPIIARLGNLPVAIRNGNGVGGGQVVGWLPLVKDNPKYKGTQQFANFKVAVWHTAFKKVLASIIPPSKHGQWVNCWDDVVRLFYTLVLILSVDYEEQSVMSLTRGVMSNFPCPICLISEDKLSSVMPHNYTLRTCQATNDLLIKARAERHKGRWEAILKGQSIRDVDNTFHEMDPKTTDVHRALCYDRLHILIVFVAHDILLNTDECKIAYLLLQCIRAYLKVDLYAAVEVHTMETIATGCEALQYFSELMNVYHIRLLDSEALQPDKNWSFPKIHLAAHLFDDIEAKGATRNYNTKPNKKCHGPLKESYSTLNQFQKCCTTSYYIQILRADHWSLISEFIRGRVDKLAAYNAWMDEDEVDKTGLDTNIASNFHIRFGSRQPKNLLRQLRNNIWTTLPSVDFCQTMDYFHCSPRFHSLPRYDCIIINTATGVFFAWLLFLFTCNVNANLASA
ncbi:hypothetical protein EV702DRAFT_1180794 [Suillus placidus]|uniref:Uncharacterized protein n=1 Tax=Suillus placidus TaxID=48579 RepID=A0A9P7CZ81_9AGAM|nr:hypothetical protein EV702DRAFT_1180794 [Suillus placidus]